MSIDDSEREWFDRARRRLNAAPLDDLTTESTNMALSKAESCLEAAPADERRVAEAIASLSVAFTHFASGAGSASEVVARRAVEEQARLCDENRRLEAKAAREKAARDKAHAGGFVEQSKKALLSAPLALSIFLSACVLKFGEKILELFF